MHDCEEFRERITEHIIDREEISARPEFQRDLMMCSSCTEFYAQAREMIHALDGIDLAVSESQWWGIERRLQAHLIHAQPEKWNRHPIGPVFVLQRWIDRSMTPLLLSAAALLLISFGLSRLAVPIAERLTPGESAAVYVEHSVPLDPVTIDFLAESELLLQNVMKIEPVNAKNLAGARKAASEQLAALGQRREAAADVPPVVSVMNTYETILRDLRNVDEQTADEDISDIQKRIQKNALIANIKAFQPKVTEISFGLR